MKIKRILKQAIFDQYWTFLFTTINFYMCTLYYFYFLSSRVTQLTPYFMILIVLIFIVNQNLLNQHSILLLFSFVLFPFCFLYFLLLLFALLLSYNYYCYLLITVIIYSLIYLFIYLYYIIHIIPAAISRMANMLVCQKCFRSYPL